MTDSIEKEALAYIERIQNLGGMLKAIESGYVQKEIQDSAYRSARAQESGEEIIVGVNAFQAEEQPIQEILTINPDVEKRQIERLRSLRGNRDFIKVENALKEIESSLLKQENVMEPLIEALLHYATLGEVSDLLRKHFGEYHETAVV